MEVVGLKTVSGHDLIARKHFENTYSHIRVFTMYHDTHGREATALMPYLTFNPDVEAVLSKESIVTEYPVPMEVERSYSETVSGIKLSI